MSVYPCGFWKSCSTPTKVKCASWLEVNLHLRQLKGTRLVFVGNADVAIVCVLIVRRLCVLKCILRG
jgi:hypothetical protein